MLIQAKGLDVTLAGKPVLKNVDIGISKGEIVTLVGPNGSGKSTLIRTLLGIVAPANGEVVKQARLRIGYVPQKMEVSAVLPMSVLRFLGLPVRQSAADMARVLDRVGATGLETRQLASLSGGQLQRVLLARALLGNPDILILDEPTQGLDQQGVASFYQLIAEVRHEMGCAILLVSHDLHVVMSASDRVICLNGHVCCQGSPQVVSAAPEYRELFGIGTKGALALYRHEHDHAHHHDQHTHSVDEGADVG